MITYFLLCGYTPFDRDTNLEEMQAILAADYKFEPADYWQDVSDKGMSPLVCLWLGDGLICVVCSKGLYQEMPYN